MFSAIAFSNLCDILVIAKLKNKNFKKLVCEFCEKPQHTPKTPRSRGV
jgi:hypothetical protein